MKSSSTPNDLGRYHSLLATAGEAKENKSVFFSDHLPMLAEIAVGDDHLRAVTWNIQIPNMASGFDVQEEKNESDARQDRILHALDNMIAEQKADVILLQECFLDEKKIEQWLQKTGWKVDGKLDSSTLTFYNPERAVRVPEHNNKPAEQVRKDYEPLSTQSSLFSLVTNPDVGIKIDNVHLPHEDVPLNAESYILRQLRESHQQKEFNSVCSIVAGDFNNRYVPVDKSYLTNSVVSSRFRDKIEIQGVDFTDGFFLMNGDLTCHQPAGVMALDPATGKRVADEVVDVSKLDARQRIELSSYRPALGCAAEHYEKTKLTAAELDDLRQAGIVLGFSVTPMNSQKPAVHFRELYKNIDHLQMLDACYGLLTHDNQSVCDAALEGVARVDSVMAVAALAKMSPDDLKSRVVANIIQEAAVYAKESGLDQANSDLFIKFVLLSKVKTPAAEKNALFIASSLMRENPRIGYECLKLLNPHLLTDSDRRFLVRRMIAGSLMIGIEDAEQAHAAKSKFTRVFSGKDNQTIDEFRALLTKVDKANDASILECISMMNDASSHSKSKAVVAWKEKLAGDLAPICLEGDHRSLLGKRR